MSTRNDLHQVVQTEMCYFDHGRDIREDLLCLNLDVAGAYRRRPRNGIRGP